MVLGIYFWSEIGHKRHIEHNTSIFTQRHEEEKRGRDYMDIQD